LSDFGAPGLYFIDTFGYFNNPERKASSGQTENVPGGYHVYGINDSFKFNWVTPLKVLGGNVAGIIQPAFGYVHTRAAGRTQSVFSFSDLNFGMALNWRGETFFHYVEVDSWAPTGHFCKGDIVATGTNYWSVMPMCGLHTWILAWMRRSPALNCPARLFKNSARTTPPPTLDLAKFYSLNSWWGNIPDT
jgi:hypothetical protein